MSLYLPHIYYMLTSMNWLENDWTTYATFKVNWKMPIRSWESDANFSVVCCSVVKSLHVSSQFQTSLLLYWRMVPVQLWCWFIDLQSLCDPGYSGFLSHWTIGRWIICRLIKCNTKKSITSGSHESVKLNNKIKFGPWPAFCISLFLIRA